MTTLTHLSSQARSALRSAAHGLRPVVMIGDQGLTESVLKEIDVALKAHELIKIKTSGQERPEREEILAKICEQAGCQAVHHLGKTLIVYRQGSKGTYATHIGQAKPAVPAKRKSTELHTPKKMAALGKKITKRPRPAKKEEDLDKPTGLRAFSAEKPTRPTTKRTSRGPLSASKPVRRSALSLRSGVRRRKD